MEVTKGTKRRSWGSDTPWTQGPANIRNNINISFNIRIHIHIFDNLMFSININVNIRSSVAHEVDLATAKHLGRRVAKLTLRLN